VTLGLHIYSRRIEAYAYYIIRRGLEEVFIMFPYLFRWGIIATLTVFWSSGMMSAQEEPDSPEAIPTEFTLNEDELILDRVKITGAPAQWSKGVSAYLAGDYELAQKLFTSFANGNAANVLLRFDLTGPGAIGGGLGFGTGGSTANSLVPARLRASTDTSAVSATRIGGNTSNSLVGIQAAQHNFASAFYWKGLAAWKQGDRSAAKLGFMQTIRNNRRNHDARMRVGIINLMEGNLPLAKKRLRQLRRYCNSYPCDGIDTLSRSVIILTRAIELYEQNVSVGQDS